MIIMCDLASGVEAHHGDSLCLIFSLLTFPSNYAESIDVVWF